MITIHNDITGKHFVKEHIIHTQPSKKHPEGTTKKIHDHCATNPSKKDILTFDEIQIITKKYFPHLSGPPKTGVLKGYAGADKFDAEIRGWTRYWNDIPSGQGDGRARGLMQVTDQE